MNNPMTVGPHLFHWPSDKKRDFYSFIADEVEVGTVYIGEVVCHKRAPFMDAHWGEIITKLQRGGKTVVFSTLAEVMLAHDRRLVEGACEIEDIEIEANDASALYRMKGKPHRIGQYLNVYNEDSVISLSQNGASHFSLPSELRKDSLETLGKTAKKNKLGLEVQVFGRTSLALSARCYHARAHGRIKDNCQFVCEEDPDGLLLTTLDREKFLCINGIQTLSYTYLNLIQEIQDMGKMGVTHFRISPHSHDIRSTASAFLDVVQKRISPEEGLSRLQTLGYDAQFSNGFYHNQAGRDWIDLSNKIAVA